MLKNGIDPSLDTIISVVVALIWVGAQGTLNLPKGVPPEWAPYIASWCTFLVGIYIVIAPFFPAFASKLPGPLVKESPK